VGILPVVVDTIALLPVVVGTVGTVVGTVVGTAAGTVVGMVVGMMGTVGTVDMVVVLRLVAVMVAHLHVVDIDLLPADMGIVVVEDMEIVVVKEGETKRFLCWFGI
jgi:hypothetical protein